MPDAATVEQTDETTENEEKATPTPRNPKGKSAYERAGEAGRKLGSRITARQITAVEQALEAEGLTPGKVVDAKIVDLKAYMQTGERDSMGEKSYGQLKGFVKVCQAQEALENDSQRRRLWPRKVAAILVELAS